MEIVPGTFSKHIFIGVFTRPTILHFEVLSAVPARLAVGRIFRFRYRASSKLIISWNKLPLSIRHLEIQFLCGKRTRVNPKGGAQSLTLGSALFCTASTCLKNLSLLVTHILCFLTQRYVLVRDWMYFHPFHPLCYSHSL